MVFLIVERLSLYIIIQYFFVFRCCFPCGRIFLFPRISSSFAPSPHKVATNGPLSRMIQQLYIGYCVTNIVKNIESMRGKKLTHKRKPVATFFDVMFSKFSSEKLFLKLTKMKMLRETFLH